MYRIKRRYQTWGTTGKVFCRWIDEHGLYETMEDAKRRVQELKEAVASTEKATKLKYEFEIEDAGQGDN